MSLPSNSTPASGSATSGGEVHPPTYFAIVGFLGLLSVALLMVSWPGYTLARDTRRAESALREENWATAATYLRNVTARYPDAWLRQRQLGDVLLELNRPAEALRAYKTSLESEPGQDLRAKLAWAQYRVDPENTRGLMLLKEILAEKPSDPLAHFYVARILKDRDRYRQAADHFLGATGDPSLHEQARPHIREIAEHLLNSSV